MNILEFLIDALSSFYLSEVFSISDISFRVIDIIVILTLIVMVILLIWVLL